MLSGEPEHKKGNNLWRGGKRHTTHGQGGAVWVARERRKGMGSKRRGGHHVSPEGDRERWGLQSDSGEKEKTWAGQRKVMPPWGVTYSEKGYT